MIEKLISSYVDKLTLDEIKDFAYTNGIYLTDDETKLIYKYIKSDWHTICYGNPRPILDRIKETLDIHTYNKIENLYIEFKNKYSCYL